MSWSATLKPAITGFSFFEGLKNNYNNKNDPAILSLFSFRALALLSMFTAVSTGLSAGLHKSY